VTAGAVTNSTNHTKMNIIRLNIIFLLRKRAIESIFNGSRSRLQKESRLRAVGGRERVD